MRKYGSYDSEQETLITYRGMSWSDFLADPARYINAAWAWIGKLPKKRSLRRRPIASLMSIPPPTAWSARPACDLGGKGHPRGSRGRVSGNAAGGLPFGESTAPRIWVREGDAGRAREIIEEFTRQLAGGIGRVCPPREPEETEESRFCASNAATASHFPASVAGMWRRARSAAASWTCRTNDGSRCRARITIPARLRKAERPESPGPGSRTATQLWIEVLAVLSLGLYSLSVCRDCRHHGLACQHRPFALCVQNDILYRRVVAGCHAGVGNLGIIRGLLAIVRNRTPPLDCRRPRRSCDLVHRHGSSPFRHVSSAASHAGRSRHPTLGRGRMG